MNTAFGQYKALLVKYLKPQWPKVFLLAFLLFGGIALQIINPQILGYFLDSVAARSPVSTLTVLALLFFGVGLLTQLVTVLTAYVSSDVGWNATNRLRADLALHCVELDMPFHNVRTPGELIERIDGDVTALTNFFSQFVLSLFGYALLLVGILVVLFFEDWRVGAVFAFFTLVTLLVLNRLRGTASPHWSAGREASAKMYGFLEERLAGLNDIRSNGAGEHVMHGFLRAMRLHFQTSRRARMTSEVVIGITYTIFTVGSVAAFAVGVYLAHVGVMGVGRVYLIVYYTGLLFQPLIQLIFQIDDLQKATASIKRVTALYHTESSIRDGPGAPFPAGPLAVEFQHVAFGYGAGDLVLKEISFRLEPGRVLGLLGRTGSGKTTLTRLLFRLYDPTSGVVGLGDVDLRDARQEEVRGHIGMVTQEVQLFQASVRDNLAFFDRTITDERMLQVLHEVELSEWFAALPEGLDTQLASGGTGLSAGEAQLLAFARVFLKDPSVVIFDEASSRLDPATERRIEHAMNRLLQGRTGVIIAHHLATIQRVDEIMILEEGCIREYGLRTQLARDPTSRFSSLLRTAMGEELT